MSCQGIALFVILWLVFVGLGVEGPEILDFIIRKIKKYMRGKNDRQK